MSTAVTRFRLFDNDPTQSLRRIEGYTNTIKRSPGLTPVKRYVDDSETTGPIVAPSSVRPEESDLAVVSPGKPRALGQLMTLTGRVLGENGQPMPNVLLEVWHANCAGKYIHHNDPSPVPVDPNFLGVGRVMSDSAGRYRLRTIKPGAYAVPDAAPNWWRPPHIHFSLIGPTYLGRLVTQIFFPGEPLNAIDLILNAVPDADARNRLICHFAPDLNTPDGALGFTHDFVLRGPRQTPADPQH